LPIGQSGNGDEKRSFSRLTPGDVPQLDAVVSTRAHKLQKMVSVIFAPSFLAERHESEYNIILFRLFGAIGKCV
jgi:hypothetical protein